LYDFSQDPPAQIHWSTFAGLPDPPATMIPQVDGVVTSGPAGASCILRIIVQTPAGPKPFKWAGTDTVQVNQQGRGHVTGMTYESDAYPQNI
jgi:hypothetical protein